MANGCYMFRTKAFRTVNQNMEIVASSGGQNWQILIPISYYYKCGYIDECLFNYKESANSHSHRITSNLDEELSRSKEHERLLLRILSEMDVDLEKYEKIINKKYLIKNIDISIRHYDYNIFLNYYYEYVKRYGLNIEFLLYKILRFKFLIGMFYRVINKIKGIFNLYNYDLE